MYICAFKIQNGNILNSEIYEEKTIPGYEKILLEQPIVRIDTLENDIPVAMFLSNDEALLTNFKLGCLTGVSLEKTLLSQLDIEEYKKLQPNTKIIT